jgi:hypothetical protein
LFVFIGFLGQVKIPELLVLAGIGTLAVPIHCLRFLHEQRYPTMRVLQLRTHHGNLLALTQNPLNSPSDEV